MTNCNEPNRVIFFDTTSRDGKQSPGCNHSPDDTVILARQLEKLRVDIMEAGFPIASDADFEAVRRVASEVSGIRVCALARAVPADIKRAAEALDKAIEPPRIHTFIASSDVHMDNKLLMTPDEVLEAAQKAVLLARRYIDDVEFSPEDSSRTGFDFLKRIIICAIEAGATTINIPDTVGYAVGDEYGRTIARVFREIPIIREKGIVISVHCHNDLGHATANTLAGIRAGARQVECTINGIGERAGNTHFAEVVMALKTRKDYFGLNVDIDTTHIGPMSRLLAAIVKKPVSDTLPIVGGNVFRHSSGIHQDGVLKDGATYEIMSPKDVGWTGESFPLTSHSGRHGLKKRLADIGYTLTDDELRQFYGMFTALADTKTFVYNTDLHLLMQELLAQRHTASEQWITFERVEYHKIEEHRSVTVHLCAHSEEFEASGTGNGPVSATWDAVKIALARKKLWPGEVQLTSFDVSKGTGGVEAVGTAQVCVCLNGHTAFGRGSHTDIIEACARAHIMAINHLTHVPLEEAKTLTP